MYVYSRCEKRMPSVCNLSKPCKHGLFENGSKSIASVAEPQMCEMIEMAAFRLKSNILTGFCLITAMHELECLYVMQYVVNICKFTNSKSTH